jgi:hypothetical protein
MIKCKHQFFELNKLTKPYKYLIGTGPQAIEVICDGAAGRHGVEVICADCGEIRKLWENGELEIIQKDNGKVKP